MLISLLSLMIVNGGVPRVKVNFSTLLFLVVRVFLWFLGVFLWVVTDILGGVVCFGDVEMRFRAGL